jgi:hypothetical protein
MNRFDDELKQALDMNANPPQNRSGGSIAPNLADELGGLSKNTMPSLGYGNFDGKIPSPFTDKTPSGTSPIPAPDSMGLFPKENPNLGYGNFDTSFFKVKPAHYGHHWYNPTTRSRGEIPGSITEGANSPLAGAGSYDPNFRTPPGVMQHYKGVYGQGYQSPPNDRQSAADAAALVRSWQGADDMGADFPLPGGVSDAMTNPIAGYENNVAKIETSASRNAAAVKRTQTMNMHQARIAEQKADQKKKESERMTQAIMSKEGPGPKNPKAEKKELHSTLVRHNDWYKNWSATV